MGSPPNPPYDTAPLAIALGQSERVQDKVEQAASDLSSVNEVLKDDTAGGTALARVELALNLSEAVELKVQEAAEELVAVNDALALEIDARHLLEDRLSESTAQLSASRASERESRHSALHDAITGLPNLMLFNDRLCHGMAQAQRHGWHLAVMFIDLDGFKRINDVHGHAVGDEVLRLVAQRLKAAVRTGDTVSRRSGDEFLLLMLESRDEPTVGAFASRIMDYVAEPCVLGSATVVVKASIGIALYPEDGRSAEELLKNADVAMYAAKQHKNGPAFHRSAGG
jgi:diguanylate cyclase (GGDEF)-like protein